MEVSISQAYSIATFWVDIAFPKHRESREPLRAPRNISHITGVAARDAATN